MASSGNVSNYSSLVVCAEGSKRVLQTTLMKVFVVVVVMVICVSVLGVYAHASAHADSSSGNVFASSNNAPYLQYPEGITSWQGVVYTATYNVADPTTSRILAFNVNDSKHMDSPHIFAQNVNYDLEEYPTGFDALDVPGKTQICSCASTPLNGADGLALDSKGNIWVASNLGDNLTVLDKKGHVVTTYGTSAVTQGGLMNQPSGMTFVGNTVYSSNLAIFTGLSGSPNLPFQIVSFNAGVSGAGVNGNY